ncbi:WhiB family transcriptional regulator [Streptomyces fuscigenes]|uniref:WhiB family transcriptional regulator n=1 Tax=Streptomyces fuscigenes TaxID=1528880 RepID=UPI001F2E592D|nr:WhiB family transcriptional regulator [Streptomyces fuscigenes]MCF3960330.1 WhiB family transcriptional regulator [Streptomyces fuscigenes]
MSRHARRWYSPDGLPRPPHWSQDAACVGADPDLFHPEGDAGQVRLIWEEAKSYCAGCRVRTTCLDEALERGERWGVWGGLDEVERRVTIRRARERARAARRRASKAAGTEVA